MRIASPVSPGEADVHSVLMGERWYFSRISLLRAKPPAASTTPRFARILIGCPSLSAATPTTRPSSTMSCFTRVFSQTGTSRSRSERRKGAIERLTHATGAWRP